MYGLSRYLNLTLVLDRTSAISFRLRSANWLGVRLSKTEVYPVTGQHACYLSLYNERCNRTPDVNYKTNELQINSTNRCWTTACVAAALTRTTSIDRLTDCACVTQCSVLTADYHSSKIRILRISKAIRECLRIKKTEKNFIFHTFEL